MTLDLWIEVSNSALRQNFQTLQSAVGVPVIAVVKARGYGHDLVAAGKVFAEAGAAILAVTRLDEAIALQEAGITARFLILTPTIPENRALAAERGFIQTLDSVSAVKSLPTGEYHIKIDSGMGRLGVLPSEFSSLVAALKARPEVRITGTFTHFAQASNRGVTLSALARFEAAVTELKSAGINPGMRHAANSVAAFTYPEARLDAVRLGTVLYGQFPGVSDKVPQLRPTWRALARVIAIRDLPKGATVGYGAEVTLCRPTRVAVLPVGFSDGFTLSPDGPRRRMPLLKVLVDRKRVPTVKFNGKSALTLGRVSMQLTSVDVTELPEVTVGSIAEIPMLRLAASEGIPRVLVD